MQLKKEPSFHIESPRSQPQISKMRSELDVLLTNERSQLTDLLQTTRGGGQFH